MKNSIIFSLVASAIFALGMNSCIKIVVSDSDSEESSEVSTEKTVAEASKPEPVNDGRHDMGSYTTRDGVVYGTEYDWLSSEYATYADISNLQPGQVRVLKNSIYARHGRKFRDANLRDYFNTLPWYNGTRDEVTPYEFNKYETKNIAFLRQYEQ